MPDEFYIIKESGVERWSDERAIGTLVVSGVASGVALETVNRAHALFREFGARAITSKDWVLLSEEIRRGNLGAAAALVMELSKDAPEVEPTGNPEWDSERMRQLTTETIARGRRTDSYGHLQANEAYYVATISAADPVLGLITARQNEVIDVVTLRAGREAVPAILSAFDTVLQDLPDGVKPEAFADLKRRLYALTSDPALADIKALHRNLVNLTKRAQAAGQLSNGALATALSKSAVLFCPTPAREWSPTATPDDPLAPHRLDVDEI